MRYPLFQNGSYSNSCFKMDKYNFHQISNPPNNLINIITRECDLVNQSCKIVLGQPVYSITITDQIWMGMETRKNRYKRINSIQFNSLYSAKNDRIESGTILISETSFNKEITSWRWILYNKRIRVDMH